MTAPGSQVGCEWQGWGTALKPAWEPIIVARKPLGDCQLPIADCRLKSEMGNRKSKITLAANVLAHGTGGLNIDACRLGGPGWERLNGSQGDGFCTDKYCGLVGRGQRSRPFANNKSTKGRWPANLLLAHSPDCRCVGKRRVKGAHPHAAKGKRCEKPYRTDQGSVCYAANDRVPDGFYDADGLETVETWACVPDCPVRILDGQSGHLPGPGNLAPPSHTEHCATSTFGNFRGYISKDSAWGDKTGGPASRFFYTAKASRTEREAGLRGHLPCVRCGSRTSRKHILHTPPRSSTVHCPPSTVYYPLSAAGSDGVPTLADIEANRRKRGYPWHIVRCLRNDHPTVKPLALMRWLVRLVTPPGGTVLDPFLGSGTTAVAAVEEGFDCIGIDRDRHSLAIARWRCRHAASKRTSKGT